MSQHPEFDELGNRIKATRPKTEPLPFEFRQQLRSELEEKSRMKQAPIIFNRLAGAVVALVLLVGVPLFFWQMLGSNQETASSAVSSNPASIESSTVLEESAPIIADTEPTEAPVPVTDRLELLSAFPAAGGEIVVAEDTAVSITLAYELHTADVAELIIQLMDTNSFVIGTTNATVMGGAGEITAVISLNTPESILEETEVKLSVSLKEPESERTLLEFMPAEVWHLQPATANNIVEIINLPIAEPTDKSSTIDGSQLFEIDVEMAYELTDYDVAMVNLAGFYEDSGMFGMTQSVVQGSGNLQMVLTLSADDLNEDGSINEDRLTIKPFLIAFDEAAQEYVILYPDVDKDQRETVVRWLLNPASDPETEQTKAILDSLVPSSDFVIFSRMSHEVNEAGQLVFTPRVIYAQESIGTSQVEVTLEAGAELLATDTISITTYNDARDLVLAVDAAQIADDVPLTFTATMTNEAGELRGVDWLTVTLAELQPDGEETAVWFIRENQIENGDKIHVQLLIGYTVGADQTSAMFNSSSRYMPYQASGGGGGGGGGPILPGKYLEIINFNVHPNDLENGRTWQDVIGYAVEIVGVNENGEQSVLATLQDGLPVNMGNGGGGGGG